MYSAETSDSSSFRRDDSSDLESADLEDEFPFGIPPEFRFSFSWFRLSDIVDKSSGKMDISFEKNEYFCNLTINSFHIKDVSRWACYITPGPVMNVANIIKQQKVPIDVEKVGFFLDNHYLSQQLL